MKWFRLCLVFAAAVGLSGCSQDGSTGPGDGDEPEATASIGPGGGKVEVDDFVLEVPEGAFSSEVELELYEFSEDHGFGSNSVSRCFLIQGLPDTYSDSLLIRIAYEGPADSLMHVAHGESARVMDSDFIQSVQMIYTLYEARKDSGFVVYRMPPTSPMQKPAVRKNPVDTDWWLAGDVFVVVINQELWASSEHVKIYYPLYLMDHVTDIAGYFEAGHDTVSEIGIGYTRREWSWPAKVIIRDFRDEFRYTVGVHCFGRTSAPQIALNGSVLVQEDIPIFRPYAFLSMLAAAQAIPDAKTFVSDLDHLAWSCAVRGWFEEKFTPAETFVRPLTFAGNEMSALQGLPVNVSQSDVAKSYGYGWAAVIKYLARRYGDGLLGDAYARMQSDGMDPVEALFESIPDPAYNWWPHFVDRYVSGEIYAVEDYEFLSNVTLRYTVDDASDTSWTDIRHYRQLQTFMYRFDLEYALIDDAATMEFSLASSSINPDYLTVLVYKITDGNLSFLAEGNPVAVDDIKDLTLVGDDLLAVAVNSYNDEPYDLSEIAYIKARVISEPQLDYNYCEIALMGITAHVHYSNGGEGDYDTVFNEWWSGYGTFTDNVFYAQYETTVGDATTTGTITVAVDTRNMRVSSFYAHELYTDPSYTFDHSVESVEGYEIPLGGDPEVDLIFLVEGSHNHPCDYFDYEAEAVRELPGNETRVETTTGTECLGLHSRIEIKFFNR